MKVTTTTVINMDIEPLDVDQNPCGHQTSQQKKEVMENFTIGITTQDKDVIIVKSMDISVRIASEHTSVVTTTDG